MQPRTAVSRFTLLPLNSPVVGAGVGLARQSARAARPVYPPLTLFRDDDRAGILLRRIWIRT
jgi:hypothetical protein